MLKARRSADLQGGSLSRFQSIRSTGRAVSGFFGRALRALFGDLSWSAPAWLRYCPRNWHWPCNPHLPENPEMRPRVLLLDDDDLVRALIVFAIEDMDIELVECTSVAQAMALLQTQAVDGIILDLGLPKKDGMAILTSLRELGEDESLLVQSGKPVGVFKTHVDAPRVLIANSN